MILIYSACLCSLTLYLLVRISSSIWNWLVSWLSVLIIYMEEGNGRNWVGKKNLYFNLHAKLLVNRLKIFQISKPPIYFCMTLQNFLCSGCRRGGAIFKVDLLKPSNLLMKSLAVGASPFLNVYHDVGSRGPYTTSWSPSYVPHWWSFQGFHCSFFLAVCFLL